MWSKGLTSISSYTMRLWVRISIVFYTYLNPVSMLMLMICCWFHCKHDIKRDALCVSFVLSLQFEHFAKVIPWMKTLKWYFWDAFIYGVFQGAGNNEMFHTVHDPCFMSLCLNSKTIAETQCTRIKSRNVDWHMKRTKLISVSSVFIRLDFSSCRI